MKNICFVDNHNKTSFFLEVAKQLINEADSFWIVFSKKRYDLLSKFFEVENILLLNKDIRDKKSVGEFKIIELAHMDRVLRFNTSAGIRYLRNLQLPFINFIRNNKINLVVGEMTYAHEVLMYRMLVWDSLRSNCIYLNPHTIRIPSNRFAFFNSPDQNKFIDFLDGSECSSSLEVKKPKYFHRNNEIIKRQKSLVSRIRRIKRFLTAENIQNDHPSLISSRFIRLKIGLKEEFNRFIFPYIPISDDESVNTKNFVFYPLHKQPEASIDVIGMYYENQLTNLLNISRFIPEDFYLVVKEHPNAVGDRGYSFYRALLKRKNIILVSPSSDSHYFIKKAHSIFTVSGTPAYEAALMGKISFTFGECFFNKLKNCHKISIEDFRIHANYHGLIDFKQKLNAQKMNKDEFSEYINKHSFVGNINDPVTDSSCMSNVNITDVSNAFVKLLKNK
ncbi:hypothetical protein [Carboxylicivirga sp. N1Y90]|uniref:hypothetical protein n=1 Tax=Carboxylicivirga fragile TaxID=3417571 RepID=UPI003D340499|nr:hypothetical protein [Marinilabiliaceae bacterium N1Y90]